MSHKRTWACDKPDGDGCDGDHTMSDATDTEKIVLKTEELKDMALATYKVRETVVQHEIKTLTEELRQTKERLARAVEVIKEIKAHGCCVMHNDSGCPGCKSSDFLAEMEGK